MRGRSWAIALFSVVAVGCGPSATNGEGGDGETGTVLTIAPGDVELVVQDGVAAAQSYTASAKFADGTERDVTGETTFTIEDTRLGSFAGAVFTAPGAAGGHSVVRGHFEEADAQAELVVRVEGSRVNPSAPANAPDLFAGASEDAARAPAIVYPATGTYVPPNLGDLETHWTDAAGNDLFEVRLHGAYVDVRVYMAGTAAGAGRWGAFLPEEWRVVGESQRGEPVDITVRGIQVASPGAAGTSPAVSLSLANEDIDGGIYYWAAAGALPAGIYRHDMKKPAQPAESFYTTAESPNGRCVACHAISRDGTRMAITLDGGDGASTILDVATRTPMLPEDGTYRWNFASFDPTGTRMVTVYQGLMVLRDAATGASMGSVATTGWATHPDFSPAGDAVVYASAATPSHDWTFRGGSVVVQPFDAASDTFGAPHTLVPADGGNAYYPSWSPDGRWILFNRSTNDSYNDPTAEIWVVPADGSAPATKLDTANLEGGVTNSWARWAPFQQTLTPSQGAEEPMFWLTFSSKRAFGVRLPAGQPQVWMVPFFPARAANGDPSAPAFRLPFQDITTSNHIAQWTERVVDVE